jgi:hypothetical protein
MEKHAYPRLSGKSSEMMGSHIPKSLEALYLIVAVVIIDAVVLHHEGRVVGGTQLPLPPIFMEGDGGSYDGRCVRRVRPYRWSTGKIPEETFVGDFALLTVAAGPLAVALGVVRKCKRRRHHAAASFKKRQQLVCAYFLLAALTLGARRAKNDMLLAAPRLVGDFERRHRGH